MPAAPPSILRFENVTVRFDEVAALENVSFEAFEGESRVILGAAGSGKTILLKAAMGLIKPDAGKVFAFDKDLSTMREKDLFQIRSKIGMLFQEGALFDSMTIEENVAYPLENQESIHCPPEKVHPKVQEALNFVELGKTLEKFPAELSGGMRRRAAIARAVVTEPPLILYDSPTAGLDPVTSQTIITLILRGRDLQDVTSLLATHRVQDAFGLANYRFDTASGRVRPLAKSKNNGGSDGHSTLMEREKLAEGNQERNPAHPTTVLMLRDGKIYFEGPADTVLHSKDEYLKRFLASAE